MKVLINIKYTYLTIIITIIAIVITLILNISIYLGLLVGLITASIIAFKNKYSLKEVFTMIIVGIKGALIVVVMMALIGILISIWMACGTIPTMIFYGFKYLSNTNIILAAFLASSAVSMVMGTALGAISTIGTVFLSLSVGLGIPLTPLVGAIVSGSYLGDRTSPMSSSVNLAAAITETNVIDNIKHMIATTLPVFFISTLLYWFIGNKLVSNTYDFTKIEAFEKLLFSNFKISLVSLIPPLLILISVVLLKTSIVKSIILGLAASIFIFLVRNGASFRDIINIGILGYYPENKQLTEIMSGGGFVSMKNVLLVIVVSTGLNGVLEGTQMITPVIENFTNNIKDVKNLIHKTALLCIAICAITCSQAITTIIPGQYLKRIYGKLSISRNTLVRTISDAGIVIVALIPWNINAILVSSIMKVPTLHYFPYAFLCYIFPVLTFIYPYFNIIRVKYDNNIASSPFNFKKSYDRKK
ncbi:Na+/H+ antiporter NhaC family protein [Paramaledivibacter caminithermalis]|jgi:NhaC family Na+:H+ antiporter|uniref:Na+:H+ antiporter, NhaC family n=1 Tax=Paramaledivibacter caminithermalis (strain DSM 15212 / CIP 107654 / DViRD3) TaxID=1121301 RepID=A0A1M6P3V6_PARC5|nr:Na+/H+ antiporter NhaC family protein [Paramaledivibacter caminithermalis]SHK02604.1 Na+:H+ antiporter, NhaC family [Paramaledivibacter caminithermalis DSM 15212]